jgi:hypothetical protein
MDSCGVYRNTRGQVVVAYPACVEGPPLTLPLPELRTFGSQLLKTLAYLHERNINHCDVQRAKVGWGYCATGSSHKQVCVWDLTKAVCFGPHVLVTPPDHHAAALSPEQVFQRLRNRQTHAALEHCDALFNASYLSTVPRALLLEELKHGSEYISYTNTHTQLHSLTQNHTYTLTETYKYFLHTRTHTHTHTLTHSLTLTHTHTHTHTHRGGRRGCPMGPGSASARTHESI